MSYTKAELVKILAPGIIRRAGMTSYDVHQMLEAQTVSELETMRQKQIRFGVLKPEPTAEEVEQMLAGIRAEAERLVEQQLVQQRGQFTQQEQDHRREAEETAREYAFAQIFRLPIDGRVAQDTIANRNEILSWLNLDEQLSREWFARILTTENPVLARRLSWASADSVDPVKQRQAAAAQADEDRSTFNAFARANGFSEVEANFRLAVSVLGSGFNQYQLEQAVTSNALRLAPASQQELAQYAQDAAEARQEWLVNQASPAELREAANRESEQLRVQAQRQQVEAQVQAREQIDAQQGYQALPTETNDGQKIDRAYLLKLADTNIKQYKLFCNRYGFAAVTARINGVR